MPEPIRVSPSRVGTYADCGKQYEFKYIQKIPPPAVGSYALFGKVVHKAREWWITDRSQDLRHLMVKAWREETTEHPTVAAFLVQYSPLSARARKLEQEIRDAWAARGKESKAPRMTKEWKQSPVGAEIEALVRKWLPKLNQSTVKFTDRDPLPVFYDDSLVLAAKYQEKYRHLPPALHTEFAFEFEWRGFQLNGFIDEICVLLDRDTGEMIGYGVIDAKTHKQVPDHDFKHSRQLVIYDLAVRHCVEHGILDLDLDKYPLYPIIELTRLCEWQTFPPITQLDHRRLLGDLKAYARGVKAKVFIPASKSCKADFCDYAGVCADFHGNQANTIELNVA